MDTGIGHGFEETAGGIAGQFARRTAIGEADGFASGNEFATEVANANPVDGGAFIPVIEVDIFHDGIVLSIIRRFNEIDELFSRRDRNGAEFGAIESDANFAAVAGIINIFVGVVRALINAIGNAIFIGVGDIFGGLIIDAAAADAGARFFGIIRAEIFVFSGEDAGGNAGGIVDVISVVATAGTEHVFVGRSAHIDVFAVEFHAEAERLAAEFIDSIGQAATADARHRLVFIIGAEIFAGFEAERVAGRFVQGIGNAATADAGQGLVGIIRAEVGNFEAVDNAVEIEVIVGDAATADAWAFLVFIIGTKIINGERFARIFNANLGIAASFCHEFAIFAGFYAVTFADSRKRVIAFRNVFAFAAVTGQGTAVLKDKFAGAAGFDGVAFGIAGGSHVVFAFFHEFFVGAFAAIASFVAAVEDIKFAVFAGFDRIAFANGRKGIVAFGNFLACAAIAGQLAAFFNFIFTVDAFLDVVAFADRSFAVFAFGNEIDFALAVFAGFAFAANLAAFATVIVVAGQVIAGTAAFGQAVFAFLFRGFGAAAFAFAGIFVASLAFIAGHVFAFVFGNRRVIDTFKRYGIANLTCIAGNIVTAARLRHIIIATRCNTGSQGKRNTQA